MPELAPDIMPEELEKEIRDELRALPNDLANKIACHLVAAERALADDDFALAYEHAKVGRRFAARIGVVREAVGLAAYRAGHYAEALSDLRAARRLTGSDEFLPIMADCERGLGRPERALDLVRSPEAERLDRAARIELAIVESGARRDLGQHDAAVITLQRLPELRVQEPRPWSARLAFAYADALAAAGHADAAAEWFERAMTFDEDGTTDAAERYAELTGVVIEDIEEDLDDVDGEADAAGETPADSDADDGARQVHGVLTDGEPARRESHAEEVDTAREGSPAPAPARSGDGLDEDIEGDILGPAGERPGGPAVAEHPAPAGAGTDERTSAEAADDPSGGTPDGDDGGTPQVPAVQPEPKAIGAEPGMAPAFIEPDFGDSDGGDPGDVLDGHDNPTGQPDRKG